MSWSRRCGSANAVVTATSCSPRRRTCRTPMRVVTSRPASTCWCRSSATATTSVPSPRCTASCVRASVRSCGRGLPVDAQRARRGIAHPTPLQPRPADRSLARAAGFQVVRRTYANTVLFPVAAVRRLVLMRVGLASADSDVRPMPRGLRWANGLLTERCGWRPACCRCGGCACRSASRRSWCCANRPTRGFRSGMSFEDRLRTSCAAAAWSWARTDDAAHVDVPRGGGAHPAGDVPRRPSQWFIRDDWAFILTRNQIREQVGWDEWLFLPTSGHWMTVPLLVYRGDRERVRHRLVLAVPHRQHGGARRHRAAPFAHCAVAPGCSPGRPLWSAAVLLVFGAGWENIVFAIQITYGLSLLGVPAALLLVDHDGPADRRDIAGSALAVVGVMSSGFGPFFLVGIGILLALRRRWLALAVAVVPQGLALAWWWCAWGRDSPEDATGLSSAWFPPTRSAG